MIRLPPLTSSTAHCKRNYCFYRIRYRCHLPRVPNASVSARCNGVVLRQSRAAASQALLWNHCRRVTLVMCVAACIRGKVGRLTKFQRASATIRLCCPTTGVAPRKLPAMPTIRASARQESPQQPVGRWKRRDLKPTILNIPRRESALDVTRPHGQRRLYRRR